MKKRIVCVLLTLIMLLSLVPMGASAASHTTSAAAITVLKQMTSFKDKCYHFAGEEFRTGYGTVCAEKHVFGTNGEPKPLPAEYTDENGKTAYKAAHEITEKKADTALREALAELDKKVNSFATSNGLSLSQNQHDALVVFSFNAGTGWMNGNGVVKTVIKKGGTANELLNAMALWTNNADMNRRKVEVNMYMNGIYSNTTSTKYIDITYYANGGYIAQGDGYTMYYDAVGNQAHVPTATHSSQKFIGWYTETNGGTWIPVVHDGLKGAKLYANFMGLNKERAITYQLNTAHISSSNVYKNGLEKVNTDGWKTYVKGKKEVTVIAEYLDMSGRHWCKLAENAWVRVSSNTSNFVTNEGEITENSTAIGTAVVTANGYLNIRQEAGTDNKIVGALAKSDSVKVYEIKTVNGHRWGRINSGWICLTYTKLTLLEDANVSDAGMKLYAFTGKVKSQIVPKVAAGVHNNDVQITNYKEKLEPIAIDVTDTEKAITLTNLVAVDNDVWAKATWKNAELKWVDKKKGTTETIYKTRSGWIKLDAATMELNPAKYTVVADSVNVREDSANFLGDVMGLAFTLNKGTQVEVNWLKLVGENIWGKITIKTTAESNSFGSKTGWINLASKYVTRDDAPVVEEEEDDRITGKFATVIKTDSLRVRKTGATYGQQIGRLSRGTTVAVWEYDDGWYKVDSNKNGVYDYKEDGWCSEDYLEITNGKTSSTVTDAAGNEYTTDGSGKGIVANTYGGLNVRQGAGTNYAAVGKLLPGTVVEILETARSGKWGRTAQGWVSMDYITMVSYNAVAPQLPEGTTAVGSYAEAQKTTTTAVYTGALANGVDIYRTPEENPDEKIRTTTTIENVTMYELATVTKVVTSDEETVGDKTTTTTTSTTSYWARINDGWVKNPDSCLKLNALDEKVHTQTDAETLKVRQSPVDGAVIDALAQGDQVSVTALEIHQDKVWGRVETNEGTGWIRLDYMSEGAIVVQAPVQNTVTPSAPVLGNGSSTGGFVNNSTGYRYTGKVIRANEVNVRSTPSTAASKTTSLKNGQALVIYETTVAENMAWGRCDAGWIYLYYVDLTPVVNGAVDARVVYNDNTIIYTDVNGSAVAGTYSRMSTVDIYEIVGKMARTEQGWINVDNLL